MPQNFNLLDWLNYAKWAVIGAVILYVLTVFGFSLLAARVRQRSAWLAWIPLLNLYLVCRLANASPVLILPALIPGINCFVFAYLGVGMARRVGQSGVVGALFGIPLLGNLVPLLLALGNPTPEEKANPPARAPIVTALLHASIVLSLVVLVGGSFVVASRMSRAVVPTAQQATATLPKRMGGTLTEFPIDRAATNPAKPTNVATHAFALPAPGATGSGGTLAQEQLPPWMPPYSLPAVAESATSAQYRTTGSAATPVSVVLLAMRETSPAELAVPTPEQLAELGPDATVHGLELKTPANGTYRGYRVNTALATYYALLRGDTKTAVLISATDAAGQAVAERLATNIGSGEGLMEYEQYRGTFGQVPAAPPNTTLEGVQTFTEEDIAVFTEKFLRPENFDPQMAAQVAQFLPLAKAVVPRSVSLAGYNTGHGPEGYIAAVASYASSSNAWTAVQALRTLQPLIPAEIGVKIATIEVAGNSAFAVDGAEGSKSYGAILMRQGSSIVVLANMNGPSADLRGWAESYLKGAGNGTPEAGSH